jgi:hypothetical protein
MKVCGSQECRRADLRRSALCIFEAQIRKAYQEAAGKARTVRAAGIDGSVGADDFFEDPDRVDARSR